MTGETHPPREKEPPKSWQHYNLWLRVKEALLNLPKHFESAITVSGINVTEIYTFSGVLSSTIEEETVRTLNNLRNLWDPNGTYEDYVFVRQPSSFPDVLLKHQFTGEIIMGIELKSWYLLSKEGEPSFRYTVTPNACADQDLLVVVPWVLSNVISGRPIVFKPFIISARYAAEYRNYWWQHVRETNEDRTIISPSNVSPYPPGRDFIDDKPKEDKGKNFGRLARTGIMDEWVRSFDEIKILGIKVKDWRDFFKNATRVTRQSTLI